MSVSFAQRSKGESRVEKQKVPIKGWYAWAAGGALALGLFFGFPNFVYIFYYLIVIVHEAGHAVIAWLFGYPSLPSFDFVYGGGYAPHFGRHTVIVLCVYAAFGVLFFRYRRHKHIVPGAFFILGLYTLFAFTELHNGLVDFMGHGMELIIATVFLYRALSGYSVKIPLERPLYAFCGFYIVFQDMSFAYSLTADAQFRAQYSVAKGGGHVMDFDRLAAQFTGGNVPLVAAVFLFMCLLPPLVALAFYEYKPFIKDYFQLPKKKTDPVSA
jgi:hypothetical protein